MRLFTLVFLCLITFSGFGQNNPVFTKVTATWCPLCGTWGWDYMESMKDEFQTGPGVLLGVHYSGDLQNPTAQWFSDNLRPSGQPKFYVNNLNIPVGPSNWEGQVQIAKDRTEDALSSGFDVISFNGVAMENREITATINLKDIPATENELYLAVYVYENNVQAEQAGNGLSLHPNVLRLALGTTIGDVDFDGILVDAATDYTFIGEANDLWTEEELGLLAIVFEKVNNTYEIRSSQSVANFALKLDTEELLPQDIFTFNDGVDNLEILVNDDAEYQLSLHNMSGQNLMTKSFNNSVIINKTNLTSGMYVAHFRSGNAVLSQQIFIK